MQDLIYSIYDSREEAIKKMMNQVNSALNKGFQIQIKTLQNAPREAVKVIPLSLSGSKKARLTAMKKGSSKNSIGI